MSGKSSARSSGREAKEIGLREMAKMIGVSPTYISKVDRDEFPPPAEDKVRLIAGVIGCDVDELPARAGKVASDLSDIINRNPVEVAALLRKTKGLSADQPAWLARATQKRQRYMCRQSPNSTVSSPRSMR